MYILVKHALIINNQLWKSFFNSVTATLASSRWTCVSGVKNACCQGSCRLIESMKCHVLSFCHLWQLHWRTSAQGISGRFTAGWSERRTCARTCAGTNAAARPAETFTPAKCPPRVNDPATPTHRGFFLPSPFVLSKTMFFIPIKNVLKMKAVGQIFPAKHTMQVRKRKHFYA